MLSIETAWTCYTNISWSVQFPGNREVYRVTWEFRPYPSEVQYDWTCSCPSFVHQKGTKDGYCKHILQVKDSGDRCGWNAELEPTREPLRATNGNFLCPQCKSRVELIKVTV